MTTFKTYHGMHTGKFHGVPPTSKFETLDAVRVINGRTVAHWGVANLLSAMQQIGAA